MYICANAAFIALTVGEQLERTHGSFIKSDILCLIFSGSLEEKIVEISTKLINT